MNVVSFRQAIVDAGIPLAHATAIADALEAGVLNDVATKTDLTNLRIELRRDMEAMIDKRADALTLEVAKQFGDFKTEMAKSFGDLKSDLQKSIGDVRGDLTWKIYLALGLNFFGILAAILVMAKLLTHN